MRNIGHFYVDYGPMNHKTNNRLYKVEFKKDCTVEDFLTEWCDNNLSEWGEFIIHYERSIYHIKYENGKYTLVGDLEEVLKSYINKATGYGGWGNSNFNLYI